MQRFLKKLIALCLTLVMVSSLMVFPAQAATQTNITLEFGEPIKSGNDISISIVAKSTDGFETNGIGVGVGFDKEVLEYTGTTNGNGTTLPFSEIDDEIIANTNKSGIISLLWVDANSANDRPVSSNAVLGTIHFTAKSGIERCKSTLSFTENETDITFGTDGAHKITGVEKEIDVPGLAPQLKAKFEFTYASEDAVVVNGRNNSEDPTIRIPDLTAGSKNETVKPASLSWKVEVAEGETGNAGDIDFNFDVDAGTVDVVVSKYAVNGTYKITGEYGNKPGAPVDKYSGKTVGTLVVKRTTPAAYRVAILSGDTEISGTDIIGIPSTGSNEKTYKAQAYDQYGDPFAGATLAQDPAGSVTGISFAAGQVTGTGTVTVTPEAGDAEPSITLKASHTDVSESKTLTVTAKKVSVKWDDFLTAKPQITYGDTQESAFSKWSATGKATAYVDGTLKELDGTFSVPNTFLTAGDNKVVTVTFKVTTPGTSYSGQTFTKNYPVKVNKKPVTVTADDQTKGFGDAAPDASELTFTVPNGALVGTDKENALGVTLKFDQEVTTTTPVGTDVKIVLDECTSANYDVTVTPGKLTITKAVIRTITTTAPAAQTITANHEKNTDLEKLKEVLGTLPATAGVTYGESGTYTLPVTWKVDKAFNRKGETYTFTGTLTTEPSFSPTDKKLTTTLTVKPVNITGIEGMPANLTVSKKQVTGDGASLTSLGLPTSVTLKFDNSVGNETVTPAAFDKNLQAVQAVANTVNAESGDKPVDVALLDTGFPAWATWSASILPKTKITITNKYVIPEADINFADIRNAIYGTAYTPTASVDTTGDKATNYADVTYKYTFTKGDTNLGETKPTDAGTYTMTVTVENDNYKGTKNATLVIAPKSISGTTVTLPTLTEDKATYNGKAQTPDPTVKDAAILVQGEAKVLVKDTDYTVTYSPNVNVGKVTVTITGKGNYDGATTVTKDFNIVALKLTGENTTIGGVSASYPFSGSAIEPKVNVSETVTGTLTETRDYGLAYSNNTNAGTATITVTGTGNYTGTVTKTFEITKVSLTGVVTIDVAQGGSQDADRKEIIDEGDTLTANVTKLADGTNVTYQWFRGTEEISGETGASYTLTSDDTSGSKISVKVTADGNSNYTGTVASDPVTVAAKPMPTGKVNVTFAVTKDAEGIKITAAVAVDPDGPAESVITGFFQVQWYRNGAPAGVSVIEAKDGGGYKDVVYDGPLAGGDKLTCAIVPKEGSGYTGTIPPTTATVDSSATGDATQSNGVVSIKASKPGAPVVSVSTTTNSATVSWVPGNANGSTVLNWIVTCSNGETKTVGPNETSVTFSGLTQDTSYDFTVKVVSSEGDVTVTRSGVKTQKPGTGPVRPTPGGSGGSSSDDRDETVTIKGSSRDHGTVRVSSSSPKKGDTVTITVRPDKGYEVERVTVLTGAGKNVDVRHEGGNEYTFTMPGGTVRVDVTYRLIGALTPETFSDVPDTYWAKDAIEWVNEHGYMKGNTAYTFNPEGRITRQQMWMIMARMAGANPADFTEAKAWAVANSISDGSRPGNSVTRQQMVTILYRYAELMGYSTSGGTDLSAFPDSSAVADYAQEALRWSVGNNIVGGTASGTLNPTGTATRAQFATILQRFYSSLA